MHDGRIQQVAEPMEVYGRPVNRFVAGFLGTPPMNFLNGSIEANDGALIFCHAGGEIELPGWMKESLMDRIGCEVVFGFRAEHLSVEENGCGQGSCLDAKVEVVEPLGDRMDVYFSVNGVGADAWLVANLEPHVRLKVGDGVTLYLNLDKTHVFEIGDTGANLTLEGLSEE